jgi:hypothetical protein
VPILLLDEEKKKEGRKEGRKEGGKKGRREGGRLDEDSDMEVSND